MVAENPPGFVRIVFYFAVGFCGDAGCLVGCLAGRGGDIGGRTTAGGFDYSVICEIIT